MASAEREVCVDKETFYKTVEEIKAKQKTKDSPITLFVDDKFYNRAKHFLKAKVEDEQALAEVREPTIEPLVLTADETSTITRKKWKYANDNIVTEDGRKVIPKDQLHTVLCFAHQRVAHRGRQITQKWIQDNYTKSKPKDRKRFYEHVQISCRAKARDIKSKASDTTTKWRDIRKLARTQLDGLPKVPVLRSFGTT